MTVMPSFQEVDGTLAVQHRSWMDLWEWAATSKETPGHQSSGVQWAGTATFEEAVDLARLGWDKGARLVDQKGKALFGDMGGLQYKLKNKWMPVPGSRFDVGRIAGGDPLHWVKRVRRVHRGVSSNIISIVVNCTTEAGCDENTIISRGAVVAVAANLLTIAGLNVQVLGYFGVADDPVDPVYRVEQYFEIKAPQYGLEPSQLAYVLAHPSTFRRIGLSTLGLLPDPWPARIGYPYTCGFLTEATYRGDIYLPAASVKETWWKRDDLTRRWIIETMKAQGIEELLLDSTMGVTV